MYSMSLEIPQGEKKKKRERNGENLTWLGLACLMVDVVVWRVSILLLEHLGNMTAFANLQWKTAALRKAGSSCLLRHAVTMSECWLVTQFALQIIMYSSYLGSLFVRKRKEFRRSRAHKLLRKTCSAKSKVQCGDSLEGDGRKMETEKSKENQM